MCTCTSKFYAGIAKFNAVGSCSLRWFSVKFWYTVSAAFIRYNVGNLCKYTRREKAYNFQVNTISDGILLKSSSFVWWVAGKLEHNDQEKITN